MSKYFPEDKLATEKNSNFFYHPNQINIKAFKFEDKRKLSQETNRHFAFKSYNSHRQITWKEITEKVNNFYFFFFWTIFSKENKTIGEKAKLEDKREEN